MSNGQDVVKVVADDPGTLRAVLEWILAGMASIGITLLGIVWKQHQAEIDSMKSGIRGNGEDCNKRFNQLDDRLDKIEHDLHSDFVTMKRHDTAQANIREDVISIHAKIEQIDRGAQQRHETMMQTLLKMSERRTTPRE